MKWITALLPIALMAVGCSVFQQDVATTAGFWKQVKYHQNGNVKSKSTYRAKIPKEVMAEQMDFSIFPEKGRMRLTATNWTSKNQGTIEAQGNREAQVTRELVRGMGKMTDTFRELARAYAGSQGLPVSGGSGSEAGLSQSQMRQLRSILNQADQSPSQPESDQ